MVMTDPIADMLTRMRNASRQRHTNVGIPLSKLKLDIAKILKKTGFIIDYEVVEDGPQKSISIDLRYTSGDAPIITGIQRVSKPGRRVYVGKDEVPRVMGGIGLVILSTSKGILSDREAKKAETGGEVLCYVW